MNPSHKKVLKSISLELRHLLEGSYDGAGGWHAGDLEQRLAALGVRRDREPVRVDEMPHLLPMDRKARQVVDAYLQLRNEAGVDRAEAVAEFVRETAYTWANRLLALRCMEARELIDEIILQKPAYGGRSLEHHRLAQRQPDLCAGEDDGLLAVLDKVFAAQAQHLPMLFDPEAPAVALKPSPAAIKRCMALLSDSQKVGDQDVATSDVFRAPDAFGWAYQYWNSEEKDRVFEKVRTQKGAKIEGADIIPATQLYTEPYMVKFLVQNSLGATWMGMHPDSKLCEGWEYYVRDADRAPVAKKPVADITFLDPACGSGHFLLEAFDLFYDMYVEESQVTDAEDICRSILEKNLFGIDIDARAVQIAEVAVWMKAAERASGFEGKPTNLVAAVASHLKGPLWEEFLGGFEREPSVARVLRNFGQAMEHIDELGSLIRPAEELQAIIHAEHVNWERQITQKKEANYLFPEMAEDKLSGQLPFHEVSDAEFGERMLYRARAAIHSFTETARRAATFQDQFLGYEATAGFKLLDLLGKKYDVVAANPPYTGSQSLGSVVKRHVEACFATAKRDLSAVFILKCLDLTTSMGRTAMVAQQAWMFLKQMHKLRELIIPRFIIETIGHLGSGAFNEISGAHVNVALFVIARHQLDNDHHITAIRPRWNNDVDGLARDLSAAANGTACNLTFRSRQSRLASLPNMPLAYWCSDVFLGFLASRRTLSTLAEVSYTASANQRFVRFLWESPCSCNWIAYSKGGGFCRWAGLDRYKVHWGKDGGRVAAHVRDTYAPDKFSLWIKEGPTCSPCVVWSEIGSGSMGARFCDAPSVISRKGPGVLNLQPPTLYQVLAILNSRVTTYLLRIVCSGLDFSYSYVANLHLPSPLPEGTFADAAFRLRYVLLADDPLERAFIPPQPDQHTRSFKEFVTTRILKKLLTSACLHTVEAESDRAVVRAYHLDTDAMEEIGREVGPQCGWLPPVKCLETVPTVEDCPDDIRSIVSDSMTQGDKIELCSTQMESLVAQVRTLFEQSGDATENDDEPDDSVESAPEDDDALNESRKPIPSTTMIEEIALRVGTHPISVFHLIKEGVLCNGWMASSLQHQFTKDYLSSIVLQLLGHRWPKQIEAGDPMPDWADVDGIIPLTDGVHESTLIERTRERIADQFEGGDAASIQREYADIISKPFDQWLAMEFFKHHTNQFKKRPIAWQIQSDKFTARKRPAFACLVYYHQLNSDLLEKIRTQHVGPLRQRLETELRGIESVAPAARSDRQTARRTELCDLIKELQDFDACLRAVQESAFETGGLRQFAIQDALLCLKARWLLRLSETIQAGPLAGWKTEAASAEIHGNLPDWIDETMIHLHRHCNHVGPEEWKSSDDPTPASLAALICKKPAPLVANALEHANRRWWGRLDEEILAPLRREMNERKETLKVAQAELKQLAKDATVVPDPSADRRSELKKEEQRLKSEIKELKTRLDGITKSADQLREKMAAWQCAEAASWEPWLAAQPMYDAISSVDGGRRPPSTLTEWVAQERSYVPDINDGVRVNIAPLQKAGLLAADVLAKKDLDKAIADRADWRADERRWCREGKLPQPGWW